eukprot:SAG11_NODE_2165_length_3728_cov_2.060072_2_plen_280_part_00
MSQRLQAPWPPASLRAALVLSHAFALLLNSASGRTMRIPLDGDWAFGLVRHADTSDGHRNKNSSSLQDVPTNGTISIPGSWPAQGWGIETDRLYSNWLERGLYRRNVSLPAAALSASVAAAAATRAAEPPAAVYDGVAAVWLIVERPKRAVEAFVNGASAGSHRGYLSNLRADITHLLIRGGGAGRERSLVSLELLVDAEWGNVPHNPPVGACPGASACPAGKWRKAQSGVPHADDQLVGCLDNIIPCLTGARRATGAAFGATCTWRPKAGWQSRACGW